MEDERDNDEEAEEEDLDKETDKDEVLTKLESRGGFLSE